MTNVLRYPLRNISPERISDLQEKYPNASVRIELSDAPVEGGLTEQAFWDLIALLDWDKIGNDDAVIEPVVAELANRPLRQLYDFKDILSQKLYQLDTAAHARNIGKESYHEDANNFSPDGFLFTRCCAVANGKTSYEATKKDPAQMPKDLQFAALLRIANEAHRRMKGTALRYVSAYSVETFSNGKGWENAKLPS